MKVVCDNCRAVYKIPDTKLVKPVNKATCRNCGHRMLIPKPSAGADPDERTLVTAVPPTPIGAPPRQSGELDGERLTVPIDDEFGEKTLPGRPAPAGWSPQSPMFGTPIPAARRDPPKASLFDEETVAQPAPPELLKALEKDAEKKPRPAKKKGATPAPARKRGTPVPSGHRPPSAAHDPSVDMILVLIGTFAAVCGAYILAFLSVVPASGYYTELVMWIGLAVATAGGVTAIMVLLTGGRGRRPARSFTSLFVGIVMALFLSFSLTGMQAAFAWWYGADMVADGTPSLVPGLPRIQPRAEAKPVTTDDGTSSKASNKNSKPASRSGRSGSRRSGRSSRSGSRSGSRSSSRRSSASTPARAAPAPYVAPAVDDYSPPPPAPAPSSGMVKVPMEVVDTMLRTNTAIKKCFFIELRKSGSLPPRVDVKFTLQSTGRATGVKVNQTKYRGSSLEGCLASVISTIQFPPAQKAQTLTYPFVLQ